MAKAKQDLSKEITFNDTSHCARSFKAMVKCVKMFRNIFSDHKFDVVHR